MEPGGGLCLRHAPSLGPPAPEYAYGHVVAVLKGLLTALLGLFATSWLFGLL